MFSPHSTRFFSASQAFLAGFLGGVDGFTSSFVNNEFATPLHKHFLCSVLGDSGLGQIWPSLNLFLENLKTRAPSRSLLLVVAAAVGVSFVVSFLVLLFLFYWIRLGVSPSPWQVFRHATLLRRNFAKQPWMWPTRLASEWLPALLPSGQMVASVFFFEFLGPFQSVESNRIRWYTCRNLGLIIGAACTFGLYIRILDSSFFSLMKWKKLPCVRWRAGGWLLSIEKLQLIVLFWALYSMQILLLNQIHGIA